MFDKFDYYSILAILIPGVLLAYWAPICFPQMADIIVDFPSEIDFLGFAALAIFIGQLVQTLASAIEGSVLYRLWGGRPSEVALARGLDEHYLPPDASVRIRRKLVEACGAEATDRSLFLTAMQLANAAERSKAETFNGLYAYHRALLVVAAIALLLLIPSIWWGAAADWPTARVAVFAVALVALLIVMYRRAQQRACYYVREVLQVAERVLDQAARETDVRAALPAL